MNTQPSRLTASLALAALAVIGLTGCEDTLDDFFGDDQSDRAVVEVSPTSAAGSEVNGAVYLYNTEGGVRVSGTLYGLTPGEHGFHIHTIPQCGDADIDGDGVAEPAGAAGPHWDPLSTNNHASPADPFDTRHAGDLGNITASSEGVAVFSLPIPGPSVGGEYDVLHHALMVHSNEDDLTSDPDGNAGTRVGCGVIRKDS